MENWKESIARHAGKVIVVLLAAGLAFVIGGRVRPPDRAPDVGNTLLPSDAGQVNRPAGETVSSPGRSEFFFSRRDSGPSETKPRTTVEASHSPGTAPAVDADASVICTPRKRCLFKGCFR